MKFTIEDPEDRLERERAEAGKAPDAGKVPDAGKAPEAGKRPEGTEKRLSASIASGAGGGPGGGPHVGGDRTPYSEMGLSGNAKLNAGERHNREQATLKEAGDHALKKGDRYEAADCKMRHMYNDARRNHGLANDNANRADSNGRKEDKAELVTQRDGYAKQMTDIENKHADFVKKSAQHTGRKFNSLDQQRGEDPAAKAAWQDKQPKPTLRETWARRAAERGEGPQDPNGNGPAPAAPGAKDPAPSSQEKVTLSNAWDQRAAERAQGKPESELPGNQRRAAKGFAARQQEQQQEGYNPRGPEFARNVADSRKLAAPQEAAKSQEERPKPPTR